MTKKTEIAISIVLEELDRVNDDKENVSLLPSRLNDWPWGNGRGKRAKGDK